MKQYESWAHKIQALSYAADKRGWRVQIIDSPSSPTEIRRLISYWNPHGIVIVETPPWNSTINKSAFCGVPTVFVDCDPDKVPEGIPSIRHSASKIVEMAVKEFLSLGCRDIAYVDWYESVHWSQDKINSLKEILALHGMTPRIFNASDWGKNSTSRLRKLGKWLQSLPNECGVLVVNDTIAEWVINVAGKHKIDIPNQLAVIGVNYDQDIAERIKPTLSTFMLNFVASGEFAMSTIDKGNPCETHIINIAPIKIIRRQSSRRMKRMDNEVEKAVEKIRIEACSGLKAKDVIAEFSCSRRFAEKRFREITGHSILEEIISVKLERLTELLINPRLSLGTLASRCGFQSEIVMRRQFKARFGKTMGEWRKSYLRREPIS